MAERNAHADVRVLPPLIFLVPLALGLVLSRRRRMRRWAGPRLALARVLGALAVGLFGWATATMLRAGTNPEPWVPAAALVTDGPFRRTRNPIYLAYALAYLAFAIWRGSWAALGLLGTAVRLTNRLAIEPEEAYLRKRFGEAYERYTAKTPRWLPR
ncbi:MAG: isoprenylcysteine carboxylmethyltransferase family protein [Chloroflexota bacterium]